MARYVSGLALSEKKIIKVLNEDGGLVGETVKQVPEGLKEGDFAVIGECYTIGVITKISKYADGSGFITYKIMAEIKLKRYLQMKD